MLGKYNLDIYSTIHHFPNIKLKIFDNSSIHAGECKYPGSIVNRVTYPLTIVALAPKQYEIPKQGFSLVAMLWANPMIVFMILSAVLVMGMPALLNGMTPEELEEIKKNSANTGDPMKQLSNLMLGVPPGGKASNNDDDDD